MKPSLCTTYCGLVLYSVPVQHVFIISFGTYHVFVLLYLDSSTRSLGSSKTEYGFYFLWVFLLLFLFFGFFGGVVCFSFFLFFFFPSNSTNLAAEYFDQSRFTIPVFWVIDQFIVLTLANSFVLVTVLTLKMTRKLSGVKQQFIMLMESICQEFGHGTVVMICICS